MQAITHKFKKKDTDTIKSLGYTILNSGTVSFEKFINNQFGNFNLVQLLQQLETSFAPTTTLSISRNVYVSDTPPTLRIVFDNAFTTDDEAVVFDRKFVKSNDIIEVYHNFCVVPLSHQGKGLAKHIFQVSLQQYVNIGAQYIRVHAALSGGGYVWARHGFVAVNKKEVEKILNKAQTKLSVNEFAPVEHIFNKYYTDHPKGKAFPMVLWGRIPWMKNILMGSDWHGEIDLKNSNQFSNFMNYVFRS